MNVDRERRSWSQRRIPVTQKGQAHVAEAFFGTNRGHNFSVRVNRHSKSLLVFVANFATQVVNALSHGVAVITIIQHGFAKFFDHQFVGRVGRVTHPKVDDVDPLATFFVLLLVDFAKQVWRQILDAISHINGPGLAGLRVKAFGGLCAQQFCRVDHGYSSCPESYLWLILEEPAETIAPKASPCQTCSITYIVSDKSIFAEHEKTTRDPTFFCRARAIEFASLEKKAQINEGQQVHQSIDESD